MGRMMGGAVALAAVGAAVHPSHTRAASLFVELVVESGLLAGVASVDEDSLDLPRGDLLRGEVDFFCREGLVLVFAVLSRLRFAGFWRLPEEWLVVVSVVHWVWVVGLMSLTLTPAEPGK